MTVSLTGAGSLGVKLGHQAGWLLDLLTLLGQTTTGVGNSSNINSAARVDTRLAQFEADYAAGTAEYAIIDGFATQAGSMQTAALQTMIGNITSLSQATLIDMCNVDTVLAAKDTQHAFQLLCAQFAANNSTVARNLPAVGAQTSVGSPVGNPTFVLSVVDTYGRTMQYVYPETLTFVMTNDSQSGATAGQESYQVTGQQQQNNRLSWDWLSSKYGSGATLGGSLVDGSAGNQGGLGNLTVNGDFRTFTTTDYPDNWVITGGVVTTNVANGTGTSYLSGGGSVKFVGATGTLTGIAQPFNTTSTTGAGTGGSPAILKAAVVNNAVYATSLYYKLSAGSPAAGVLRLSITDGSGTIQQNDSGTNLSTTVALTGVGDTNWHQLTLVFQLPQALPTTVRLRIDLTTGLSTGTNLFLDDVAVAPMQPLYNNGPYIAGFRGATNVNASGLAPDTWTVALTQTLGKFQSYLWRVFDPANLPQIQGLPYYTPGHGYILPSTTSGSATIADTLVT